MNFIKKYLYVSIFALNILFPFTLTSNFNALLHNTFGRISQLHNIRNALNAMLITTKSKIEYFANRDTELRNKKSDNLFIGLIIGIKSYISKIIVRCHLKSCIFEFHQLQENFMIIDEETKKIENLLQKTFNILPPSYASAGPLFTPFFIPTL